MHIVLLSFPLLCLKDLYAYKCLFYDFLMGAEYSIGLNYRKL